MKILKIMTIALALYVRALGTSLEIVVSRLRNEQPRPNIQNGDFAVAHIETIIETI